MKRRESLTVTAVLSLAYACSGAAGTSEPGAANDAGGVPNEAGVANEGGNPSDGQVAGDWINGETVTVAPPGGSLTSFGAKTSQAPTVWDHGQDGPGMVNAAWDGGYAPHYPSSVPNASVINMQNRQCPFTPQPGLSVIGGPHPYTNVILGACNWYNYSEGVALGLSEGTGGMHVSNHYAPSVGTNKWWTVREYYTRYQPETWYFALPTAVLFAGAVTQGSNQITGLDPAVMTILNLPASLGGQNSWGLYFPAGAFPGSVVTVTNVDLANNRITVNQNALISKVYGYNQSFNADWPGGDADNNNKFYDVSVGAAGQGIFNNIGSYGHTYVSSRTYKTVTGWAPPGGAAYSGTVGFMGPNTNSDTAGSLAYILGEGGPMVSPDTAGHGSYWTEQATNWANPANACNGNVNGWSKVTEVIFWSSGPDGVHQWYENYKPASMSYKGPMSWSPEPSEGWNEGIGHAYTRNQGANPGLPKGSSTGPVGARTQWAYLADAYVDVQPNAARFYLTNDPTWHLGGGTWAELLPYTAWSADGSSAAVTINKGNNRSGAAYIVFVDESVGITTPVIVAQGTLG